MPLTVVPCTMSCDRSEELATTYKDMGIDDVMKLG